MGERIVGALSLAIWLYLAAAHGRFWRTSITLPRGEDPDSWPSVVAVVPARDEAQVLPNTLPTLLAQRYPGPFRVVVVSARRHRAGRGAAWKGRFATRG